MPRWIRDTGLRPRDVALTVVVAFVQLMGSRGATHAQFPDHPLDTLAYVALLIGPLALLARHRFPLAVCYLTLSRTAAYLIGGYGYGPIFLSLVIAFLTAATTGPRWPTYALLPVGYACFVWPLPSLLGNAPSSWWQVVGIAAWLTVLVSIAEGIRQRRATVEARRQRAAATEEAEEEERLRRASDERLAIALELHDVLAHSLSLINVQSSVALELFDANPEHARTALAARYKDHDLRIQVDNPGTADPPAPISTGGNGITGMIERARALGGELSAGPRPGGGFRVSARLPIAESPVEES